MTTVERRPFSVAEWRAWHDAEQEAATDAVAPPEAPRTVAPGADARRVASHGTVARYSGSARCRCSKCRAAIAAYHRESSRRRREGVPTIEPRPFRFEDLERAIRARPGRETYDVARAIGSSRRSVPRWRGTMLTVAQADRMAIAAGFHPIEVWGDAWLSA